MISICIPVYNFNITNLVGELSKQGNLAGIPFEIIVIDDFSKADYRKQNAEVCIPHTYIELDRNIGRSKIRNLFPVYSNFEYLLYVDCDSEIISDDFLKSYISEVQNNCFQVICGGRIYPDETPPSGMRLRWKYGKKRESLPATERAENPYRYFMTNNFLIYSKLLENVRFDERIVQYGYEDTLFAYSLMKNGKKIRHIDNPVLHTCEETNEMFLEKTNKSIANLVSILHFTGYDRGFVNLVRILRVYNKIKSLCLGGITGFFLLVSAPAIRFLLRRGFARIWLYDFYKLGLLFNVTRKTKPPRMIPGVGRFNVSGS
ncbi:MAG: glycosyltransferase [Bacteroidales bacterium]